MNKRIKTGPDLDGGWVRRRSVVSGSSGTLSAIRSGPCVKEKKEQATKGHGLLADERGTVLIFMLATFLFLLVFGGFAIDLAFFSAVRGELQRSMDAAALAGAGKIALNDSVFPAVRQEAWRFADLNPARVGAINLNQNPGNDANGDIVLGVWDGATFTPSLDGFEVNAVRCQYATEVPTSFLGILGFNTLPVSAWSIAVANPANSLPPGACMFPLGVTSCQFKNAGAYTSQGCGTPMTFATSSGKPPDTQAGTNTAAWTNPNGAGTPDDETLIAAITAAAEGEACDSSLRAGEDVVGANNGIVQSAMDVLEGYFLTKYGESEASASPMTVNDANNNPTYAGYGWEVYVAVIDTGECPPQAINQDVPIETFARFVITQVINHGECAVNNPADTNSWPLCPPPMNPGGGKKKGSLRAIFGYYECQHLDTVPTRIPAPRAGLATGRRLVQ
ncbi:MAG: pilus assembly protein TadG-related protein [Candidatus Methylomirabilales bacterium]